MLHDSHGRTPYLSCELLLLLFVVFVVNVCSSWDLAVKTLALYGVPRFPPIEQLSMICTTAAETARARGIIVDRGRGQAFTASALAAQYCSMFVDT